MEAIAGLLSRQGCSYSPAAGIPGQKSLKTGWLRKQGGMIKSWQKRWFAIKGDVLYYFSREDETKPLGSILLPGNKVIIQPFNPSEPDKYLFEIVPVLRPNGFRYSRNDKTRMSANHETYLISASSEDERNEWLKVMRKVMFGNKGGAIFGQSLQETMAYESRFGQKNVPRIVEKCVAFLREHGLDVEGIFRLPGRALIVKDYREAFDHGEQLPLDINTIDVHSVSSLLKLYLRELPAPLIPIKYYEAYMKIVTRDLFVDPEKGYEDLRQLLMKLPIENYNLLRYLCQFLREVGNHEESNKMTHMNLATVFVQSFIRPEDEDPALLMGTADGRTNVTYTLINYYEHLFTLEYNDKGQAVHVEQILDFNAPDFGNDSYQNVKKNRRGVYSTVSDSHIPGELLGLDLSQYGVGLSSNNNDANNTATDGATESVPEQVPDGSTDTDSTQGLPQPCTGTIQRRMSESEYYKVSGPPARVDSGASSNSSSSDKRRSEGLYDSIQSVLRSRQAESETDSAKPKMKFRSSSVSSVISDTDHITSQEEALDELVSMDLSGCSREDLLEHIQTLTAQFKTLRDLYKTEIKNCKASLSHLQGKHKVKIAEMAKKLEDEKTATSEAVQRIVELQSKQMNRLVFN